MHVREVERSRLADRRDRALDDRRRDVGALRLLRSEGRFLVRRPLSRLQPDVEHRTAQPLLHRRLDLVRSHRRISVERLLVIIGIAGEDLALGERDRLAAEPADLLQPADFARDFAGLGAGHLVGGGAVGEEVGDDLVEPPSDHVRVDPRLHRRVDFEQADSLERLVACADPDRELLVADQDLVEPRACEPAQNRGADVERCELRRKHPRDRPVPLDLRGRDMVLHHHRLRCRHRRHVGGGGNVDRPRLDCPEIFLDQRLCLGSGDVAREHQGRVVGPIFVEEPFLDGGEAGRVEVGHRSDGGMLVRVTVGEQASEHFIFDQPARLVVALPFLVLDDAALVIQLLLVHHAEQIAHAVAFHEQRLFQRRLRDRLEIVGAVEPGGAVVIGRADLLQVSEVIARQIVGAVEHQMLEQMREAGLALRLVLGPDIVPGADRDDRRLVVLVDDDGQAVGELELRVRDRNVGDQLGDRRRLLNRGRCRGLRGRRSGDLRACRNGERRGGEQEREMLVLQHDWTSPGIWRTCLAEAARQATAARRIAWRAACVWV